MTPAEKDGLVTALGQVILDEVKKGLEPITQQLAKLELKFDQAELRVRELRYAGVWSDRARYRKGNFVSHGGSLWHANFDEVATVPGQDHDGWTLAVKSMSRA